MQLTPLNGLYLLLFSQSLFFGIFMLVQRKLFGIGIFFTALAIHMALNIVYENGFLSDFPNITFGWGLIYPPSLFFYFREMLYRDFKWQLHCLWHYLPWLMALSFIVGGGNFYKLQPLFMPLSIFGYLAAIVILVKRFKKIARQQYSQDIAPIVRWAIIIASLYTAIVTFDVVRSLWLYLSPSSAERWASHFLILMLLLLVNIMLVKRITQPRIFAGISEHDVDLLMRKNDREMEIRNGQQLAERKKIIDRFQQLMEVEKLYQQANLSLKEVSSRLAIHEKKLSAALNDSLKQNFSETVNQWRIEEVKVLLNDTAGAHKSITEIFYQVGFNSKASFNLMFKKYSGMTPSQFRQQHRKNINV